MTALLKLQAARDTLCDDGKRGAEWLTDLAVKSCLGMPLSSAKHLPNEVKVELLAALTNWADSEEGVDYRTGLAAAGQPSPVTAKDVLSILPRKSLDIVYDAIPELAE